MLRKLSLFVLSLLLALKSTENACDPSELAFPNVELISPNGHSTDYSTPNIAFAVKCSKDSKSEYVWNAICKEKKYEFSRNGVHMKESIFRYCTYLFASCLVSNADSALSLLDYQFIYSYQPQTFAFFKCSADKTEHDVIKGKCSFGVEWEYTINGKDIAQNDLQTHCSRYTTGCSIYKVSPLLVLVGGYRDIFTRQLEGTELAVKCAGDTSQNPQKATCRSASWEYKYQKYVMTDALWQFCYVKTLFCNTKDFELFIYESTLPNQKITTLNTMPIRCKSNLEKSHSLKARCNGLNWTYLINEFDISSEELEILCRDNICLKHQIPLEAIMLKNAPFFYKDYIDSNTVISAKCINVPHNDFEIECKGDTLIYKKGETEVFESVTEYCNGLIEEISGCNLRAIDRMFSNDAIARLSADLKSVQARVYCVLDSEKKFLVVATCEDNSWKYLYGNVEVSLEYLSTLCERTPSENIDAALA